LRGRKQLDAFERNLTPSQKHEDFHRDARVEPPIAKVAKKYGGEKYCRQLLTGITLTRGRHVGFEIERTLAMLAILAVPFFPR
jgi:hypothetical protein